MGISVYYMYKDYESWTRRILLYMNQHESTLFDFVETSICWQIDKTDNEREFSEFVHCIIYVIRI